MIVYLCCVKWRLVALAVTGFDHFFPPKSLGINVSLWAQPARDVCIVCTQVHPGNAFKCKECAGQTKSPATAEEKLDWSISERISALSSSSYSPLLFACFRKDSTNISNNSWRSGMSWIFVWHKSLAFLKRVTINKVVFFECPRGGSLYTHIHQVYTRLALPFLLQPHSHNEDIKHERIQAADRVWKSDVTVGFITS